MAHRNKAVPEPSEPSVQTLSRAIRKIYGPPKLVRRIPIFLPGRSIWGRVDCVNTTSQFARGEEFRVDPDTLLIRAHMLHAGDPRAQAA